MDDLTIRQLKHAARVKNELLGIVRDTNLLDKVQKGVTCEDYNVYYLFRADEDDEQHAPPIRVGIYFEDKQKNSAIVLEANRVNKNIYKDELIEEPNNSTIIQRSTGDVYTLIQINFIDNLRFNLSRPLSHYFINYGCTEPFENNKPRSMGYELNGHYCDMERFLKLIHSEEDREIVGVSSSEVLLLLEQILERTKSPTDPILERMPKEQIIADIMKLPKQTYSESYSNRKRQSSTKDGITIQHGSVLANNIKVKYLQTQEKSI